MAPLRSLPAGFLGVLAVSLGCRSTPVVRPAPRTILGRCLWLEFAPAPPPLGDWQPADTLRFLTPYWIADLGDSTGITRGNMDLSADTNEQHFADWWLGPNHLSLHLWTRRDSRYIVFDRLSHFTAQAGFVLGRWFQGGTFRYQRPSWRGVVTGRFLACRPSTSD